MYFSLGIRSNFITLDTNIIVCISDWILDTAMVLCEDRAMVNIEVCLWLTECVLSFPRYRPSRFI
jgi:hypothetical protein